MRSSETDTKKSEGNFKTITGAASQQYTQESILTLREIAPAWYDRLTHSRPTHLNRISWYFRMALPETCIVGEAYGFSSSYLRDCAKCAAFSRAFLDAIRTSPFELHKAADRFVIHWIRNHGDMSSKIANSRTRTRIPPNNTFFRSDNPWVTLAGGK